MTEINSIKKICSFDGCGRPSLTATMYCTTHHLQIKSGKPLSPICVRESRKRGMCSHPGCEREHSCKGFCDTHYNQLRRLGAVKDVRIIFKNETCRFDNCDNKTFSVGFCAGHYQQMKAGKTLKPLYLTQKKRGTSPKITCDERPCPVRDLEGMCHVLRGADADTYGLVRVFGHKSKKSAHRIIWEKMNGPIPYGLVVDHVCMVKGCCNENHLRLVTHTVNLRENVRPRKKITHCKNGHSLDGNNVVTAKSGKRRCRICVNKWQRDNWPRKRKTRKKY